MARRVCLAAAACFVFGTTIAGEPPRRSLTFEDRVNAQQAIEHVYFAHQLGTKTSFEQSVPRALLEAKVRKYLEQTAALEMYWNTPVTDEMLERELDRMAQGTTMPERLLELYAALHEDPILVKECLARAVLVDRLARAFYAFDPRFHADARNRAEALHRSVLTGELRTDAESPNRFVSRLEMREAEGDGEGLPQTEFQRARARLPDKVGQPSNVEEEEDSFVFRVVLSESAREVRVASYVVPKMTWEAWAEAAMRSTPSLALPTVAHERGPLPKPSKLHSPCPADGAWAATQTTGAPSGRLYHTAVWTGSLLVVWGGRDSAGVVAGTGGRYDPATDSWRPTSMVGSPSARERHTAVWTGNVMVVWGGFDSASVNSGGRYDPASDTWSPTSTAGAPSPRDAQSAVWTGSQMLVWGGYSGGYVSSGGRYDPTGDAWTATSTTNAPPGAANATAVWTGSVMIVWGGYDGVTYFVNTGGRYDPATDTWTPTSTIGAPTGREEHAAVWTGSAMLIWGGYPRGLNTGGRYDPTSNAWTPTSTTNAPSPRWGHSGVWTGDLLVIWGGYADGYHTDTGGHYDPSADTWTPTSMSGAPSPRSEHTAVAIQNGMMIWGGSGDSYLSTGAQYFVGSGTDNDGDGFSECEGDCDDGNATIYPGAPELCDGVKNDCNAPGPIQPPNEADADNDGYRICGGDCDDTRASVFPGAPQSCDGLNNDCSDPRWPALPANEVDLDGDGLTTCQGDCSALDPSIHPGAVELCDGRDHNCDGLIDNSPSCQSACASPERIVGDVLLTSHLVAGTRASAVATKNGYAIAWADDAGGAPDLLLAFIDSRGRQNGAPISLHPATGIISSPSVIWNGSQFGVAWRGTDGAIWLARLAGDATRMGADHRLTDTLDQPISAPILLWSGLEYGVVWHDARTFNYIPYGNSVVLARVDAFGNRSGAEIALTRWLLGTYQWDIAATVANDGFAVTWINDRDDTCSYVLYYKVGFEDNDVLGNPSTVAGNCYSKQETSNPALAWNGSALGLSWRQTIVNDGPDNGIYFRGIPAPGGRTLVAGTGPRRPPSITWSGAEYGLTWSSPSSGNDQLFWTRTDTLGNRLVDPVALTSGAQSSVVPQIVWDGRGYAFVWNDDASGKRELRFGRLGCNCSDGDGDGATACNDCDDANPTVYPGAPQICDGVNNDCSDPAWPIVPATDMDSDGDGVRICQGDCDDTRASVHPGASEICNGIDDNCDGEVDEDALGEDSDGDGIHNACDNCRAAFNPSQSDFDHDGEGDACDLNDGLIYIVSTDKNDREWQAETGYSTWNSYRGSLAVLRATGQYTQAPGSNPLAARDCGLSDAHVFDPVVPDPGEVAFNLVTGVSGGIESSLGANGAGMTRPNANPCP